MDMASTAASCALALIILNSGFLLIAVLMVARDLADLGRMGGGSRAWCTATEPNASGASASVRGKA